MSGKKHSLEAVKQLFVDCGYVPLFDEYNGNHSLLSFSCNRGHLGKISFNNLRKGTRCSSCRKIVSSLEEARKLFTDEGYTPLFKTYTNSAQSLPYICDKGHESRIVLSSWKSGVRCSRCFGNKRDTLETAREEFVKAGFTPLFTAYKNNRQLLEFICGKGHHHHINLNSLKAGRRCGMCNPTKKLKIEDVKGEFTAAGYTPLFEEYDNNMKPLPFQCTKGHIHEISLSNLKKGNRCFRCSCAGISAPEKEIVDIFSKRGFALSENIRTIIAPYEIDIYFPDKKLAIEYCGLYWHGEVSGKKARNYHYTKRKLCEERGIRLITIFEDEYLERPEVVISRVDNALGTVSRKIYARSCEVLSIDNKQASDFLCKNHLQGSSRHRVSFGLFLDGCLLGVMTGGSLSRRHTGLNRGIIEMKRLCFMPGLSVVGGASKLFARLVKYARDNGFKSIRSYQDMRYGNPWNSVYNHLGFNLVSESRYTPHYVIKHKRVRNQGLRKTPEERLTGKTEWQLRREQGYDRIWDCGHRTYDYNIQD